jgi:hypothetical protein
MQANKLPPSALELIIANLDHIFADDRQWNDFLAQRGTVQFLGFASSTIHRIKHSGCLAKA